MIEIRDLSKHYGSFHVLKGCSMTVAKGRGSWWCAGPSGSGKSTLIKCVNGLEPFESGDNRGRRHELVGSQDQPAQAARARRHGVSAF